MLGFASCHHEINDKRSISSHIVGTQLQNLKFFQIQEILTISSFEKICYSPFLPLHWMIELNRYKVRKGNKTISKHDAVCVRAEQRVQFSMK